MFDVCVQRVLIIMYIMYMYTDYTLLLGYNIIFHGYTYGTVKTELSLYKKHVFGGLPLTTKGILPGGWKMVERNEIKTHKLQKKTFFYFISHCAGRLWLIVHRLVTDSQNVIYSLTVQMM